MNKPPSLSFPSQTQKIKPKAKVGHCERKVEGTKELGVDGQSPPSCQAPSAPKSVCSIKRSKVASPIGSVTCCDMHRALNSHRVGVRVANIHFLVLEADSAFVPLDFTIPSVPLLQQVLRSQNLGIAFQCRHFIGKSPSR